VKRAMLTFLGSICLSKLKEEIAIISNEAEKID
jgi:hypothetical protein